VEQKEDAMLFAVTFTPRANTNEDREKRTLSMFTQWKPPAGYEFKSFYDYADGDGGIAIVEAASAEALLEAHAPWAATFEFRIRPVVDVEKSVGIFQKAYAWRDSIK
jgi:uncharacterized protein DUF3303